MHLPQHVETTLVVVRTTALVAFKDQTLVQVPVLATVATVLVRVDQLPHAILVPELPLAQRHIITITTLLTLRVHVTPEIQAEVEHTLVAGIITTLVRHALEQATL